MRFLSVSIATATDSGSSLCSAIRAINVVNPARPVSIRHLATVVPTSSTRATSWWASAQSIPQVISKLLSFLLLLDEPESPRSDLMDSVRDATPHQLTADPATDRATVYIETSRVGWRGVDTCQRLGPHPRRSRPAGR